MLATIRIARLDSLGVDTATIVAALVVFVSVYTAHKILAK